jgi:hypothetical protein
MDELDKSLAILIDEARTSHDPSAADARRVGAALGLVLPSLAASSTLFSGAAHAATEVASQSVASASASALKGAWLASMSTAKWLGVAVVVAAGAVGVQPYTTRLAHENPPAALAPAARTREPRMAEPLPLAPISAPTPAPTPMEARPSASRPTSARRIEANARAGTRTNQELQLIESALQALHDQDFERAARALDEHARRFASGTLVEERLGLQVLVACSRGDALAAQSLRARFLRVAPESPLAAKIARACER